MRALRIYSVLVMLLALVMITVGSSTWYVLEHSKYINNEEYAKVLRNVSKNDQKTFLRKMITGSQIMLIVGLMSLTTSIGLFKAKEWARLAWLLITGALGAYEAYIFSKIYPYISNIYDAFDSILIILVSMGSIVYLTRKRTKQLFLECHITAG